MYIIWWGMIMNKHTILLLLVFLIALAPAKAAEVGWLSDWSYRIRIGVENNVPETLVNHQIKVTINTKTLISNKKMRGDCGDARFTDSDGTTTISYWLERGCNETATIFWVEIPTLVASETKNIYFYYGAPTKTSTSSGSATFKLFDDFNSNSLGTTWQIYDGSYLSDSASGYAFINIVNSSAVLQSVSNYNFVTKTFKTSRPAIIEMKTLLYDALDPNDGKTFTILFYDPETNMDPDRYSYQVFTNSTGNSILNSSSSTSQTYGITDSYSVSENVWYIQRMTVDETNITSQLMDTGYNELSFKTIANSDWDSKRIGMDHYNNGTSGNIMFVDWIRVRSYVNTSPTINTYAESEKPPLSYSFQGSKASNMRTLIFIPSSEKNPVKLELEPATQCSTISSNSSTLSFGTLSFNSSGYSINGSFRWINATNVTYSENCERISLRFNNEIANTKTWHIVQVFKDYPLVKHIIFVHTQDDINEFNETMYLDDTCASFVNSTGEHSCINIMHSPSGYIETNNVAYCNVHWANNIDFNLTEVVSVSNGYGKSVFWEALDKNCEPFLKTFELICGVDFQNCSVSSSTPIRVPFYNDASLQKPLGKIKITGADFTKKVNGKSISGELIDTRFISHGVNYVEVEGSGNVSKIEIVLSNPYTATSFFDEKPDIYILTVKGPLEGVSANIEGIPVTDKILKFRNLDGKTHMDLGIGASTVDIDIFKTKRDWEFENSKLYQSSGTLKKATGNYLPLSGAKDILPPQLPPTHKIYSASRIFYSNNIIAELVMTTWRAV